MEYVMYVFVCIDTRVYAWNRLYMYISAQMKLSSAPAKAKPAEKASPAKQMRELMCVCVCVHMYLYTCYKLDLIRKNETQRAARKGNEAKKGRSAHTGEI